MCLNFLDCPSHDPIFNCQLSFNDTRTMTSSLRMKKIGFRERNKIGRKIIEYVKPILEKWSGQELKNPGLIYGVRRYLNGASMMLHVDKLPTHVISAILQVKS